MSPQGQLIASLLIHIPAVFRRSILKIQWVIGLAILATTFSHFLSAGENQFDWAFGSRYEFDSNPLLREVNTQHISGIVVSPKAAYIHLDETSRLSMGINTDIRRYDENAFDGADYGVDISRTNQSEINATQWVINRRDEQIRNTDIDFNGNFLASDDRRATNNLGGNWQHYLSEIHSLIFSANYQQVDYDGGGYADYDYSGLGVSWNARHTETFSTSIRLGYSDFNSSFSSDTPVYPLAVTAPATIATDSSTTSLNVGFDWSLSEKMTWQFTLGNSLIANEQSASRPYLSIANNQIVINFFEQLYTSDSRQYLFNSALSYRGRTSSISLAADAGTTGGSNGTLSQTASVSLNGDHRLLERTGLNWGFSFKRRESVDENLASSGNDSERDYFSTQITLHHQVTRALTASATLRYVMQHQAEPEYTPEAGLALIRFNYSPQTISW